MKGKKIHKYRRISILMICIASWYSTQGQIRISGKIMDKQHHSLPAANVVLEGTIEGTMATDEGNYSFATTEKGTRRITATMIGFEPMTREITIGKENLVIDFVLKENSIALSDVVITAGSFEAGDKKKGVTLKSLDIVTTASAAGDIYGALNTLPGTATIGEDGRLFVRGGDAYEAQTFIDGMRMKKPYSSTQPDLPVRGRFSPRLFTGTTFSSGGYSAKYGQALSSALLLQTEGIPSKSQWGFGLLTVGLNGSQTFSNGKSSLSAEIDYYNLAPYYSLIKQDRVWNSAPESFATTIISRKKIQNRGLLKFMMTYQHSHSNLEYPDFTQHGEMMDVDLKNDNVTATSTYTDDWENGWSLQTGLTYTLDNNRILPGKRSVEDLNSYAQYRMNLTKTFSQAVQWHNGVELSLNHFRETYLQNDTLIGKPVFTDFMMAGYTEIEAMVLKKLALRAGLRGELSSILDDKSLAPRLSLAWLVAPCCQFSFASGKFYQTPEELMLRFTNKLKFEEATHYLINFQSTKNNRIFRIEGYHKIYNHLVRYSKDDPYEGSRYSNLGEGYANGVELFLRDQQTIKNLDYWVSYSLLDSKRIYKDYREKATPTFAPRNNFSFVTKYWIPSITTQIGTTLSWASGRPYDDPNSINFMTMHTPNYFDLSINMSHLFYFLKKTSVFYTSLSNVTGRENIFGYNSYTTKTGNTALYPVAAASRRFFMIGIFLNW